MSCCRAKSIVLLRSTWKACTLCRLSLFSSDQFSCINFTRNHLLHHKSQSQILSVLLWNADSVLCNRRSPYEYQFESEVSIHLDVWILVIVIVVFPAVHICFGWHYDSLSAAGAWRCAVHRENRDLASRKQPTSRHRHSQQTRYISAM